MFQIFPRFQIVFNCLSFFCFNLPVWLQFSVRRNFDTKAFIILINDQFLRESLKNCFQHKNFLFSDVLSSQITIECENRRKANTSRETLFISPQKENNLSLIFFKVLTLTKFSFFFYPRSSILTITSTLMKISGTGKKQICKKLKILNSRKKFSKKAWASFLKCSMYSQTPVWVDSIILLF